MKILIAADIFPPQSGGPATYVVMLANELVKRGDEVRIISLNQKSDINAVRCAVETVSSQNKLFKYWQYFFLLLKRAKKVDVVYAMGPVNAGFPALLAVKLRGKRLVVKMVGDYAWEQGVQRYGVCDSIDDFQKKNNYPFAVKFLKWVEKTVAQKSNAVIVPSLYLKSLVINWGISVHCVSVIYNASSYVETCPIIKPTGEIWLISAGRLVPWKGMETLIEIMPDLRKIYGNLKLKIYGSGPKQESLKSKVKSLKLEGAVEIVGQIPRKELLCNITDADCFILNSGYEGLSHLILEAMHANTPVLASRAGGNAELVIPGKNGNLFELNNKEDIKNKIINLLGNKDKFNWEEEEKKAFFEKFSLPNMIDKTREALQNVCLKEKV